MNTDWTTADRNPCFFRVQSVADTDCRNLNSWRIQLPLARHIQPELAAECRSTTWRQAPVRQRL